MRIFLIALILLAFPVIEAVAIVWTASLLGWWLAAWLVVSLLVGLALVRGERSAMPWRFLSALGEGQDPLTALASSGRLLLAGMLLAFPGPVSDLAALVWLVWPRRRRPLGSALIEGQWRRKA